MTDKTIDEPQRSKKSTFGSPGTEDAEWDVYSTDEGAQKMLPRG